MQTQRFYLERETAREAREQHTCERNTCAAKSKAAPKMRFATHLAGPGGGSVKVLGTEVFPQPRVMTGDNDGLEGLRPHRVHQGKVDRLSALSLDHILACSSVCHVTLRKVILILCNSLNARVSQ